MVAPQMLNIILTEAGADVKHKIEEMSPVGSSRLGGLC
jgi:hypothetical protein